MPNTFFGLTISKSGMYASMAGINTTAHNISNTEKKGYSRQVVDQQASAALRVNSSYGMAGSGTDVTGVKQVRDEYFDMKYRDNTTMYGEYYTKDHYMMEIENYFNEVKLEGFTTTFNNFFDSLQELSKNPADLTTRTEVTNFAQSMCDYFNSLAESLKGIQEECNFEIKNQADRINALGQQIAALTKQINTLEVNGGTANDLRDERNLLIDSLSQIANISVAEHIVGDGVGVTSYVVRLDSQVLVDTYSYNQLIAVPQPNSENMTDVDGLYRLEWSNGQSFNHASATLGGTLAALFAVRDGNNNEAFKGITSASKGDTTVKVTATNVNQIDKLNIPQTGVIKISNRLYHYTGFQVTKAADGSFEYEFGLAEGEALTRDSDEGAVFIGADVDYKGVPYYMAQLNEFVRTFSRNFNDIHTSGEGLDGERGMDFFNGYHTVTGKEFVFGRSEEDIQNGIVMKSGSGAYTETSDINYGSYYFMTAANMKVSSDVYYNPEKVAAASSIKNGIENADNIGALVKLKSDSGMFKQGAPAAFLQTMVAEIGIDASKSTQFSKNQENICASIQNQRLSVSGVDSEEEAMNLIRYQNAYNLSAKAVSVMNQIYDKLINYMGA